MLGGDTPAPRYVLAKDHKGLDDNGLHKTRPVVCGCSSYNVRVLEMISKVLEAVYKPKADKVGVISTEDLLAKVHDINKKVQDDDLDLYDMSMVTDKQFG